MTQKKISWRFINNTLGKTKSASKSLNDSQGHAIMNDKAKADYFNNYFIVSVVNLK